MTPFKVGDIVIISRPKNAKEFTGYYGEVIQMDGTVGIRIRFLGRNPKYPSSLRGDNFVRDQDTFGFYNASVDLYFLNNRQAIILLK